MTRIVAFAILSAALAGCAADDPAAFDEADELLPGELLGKEDSAGIPGLSATASYADTQVWAVENQWEDRATANARLAGIAWSADSGLSWDEKFSRWVGSLQQTPSTGWGDTFQLTTPWGKSLPAPKLDCADVAILLRASFAAWYKLPFYLVAYDGGSKVYFGHFGIRTAAGNWNGMPRFARDYRDHSAMPAAEYNRSWPKDDRLRARGVQTGDEQTFLGAGLRTGAYLDEIHLNKRAGHLIRLILIYFGSANLADSQNTYNLVPEALRTGDFLLFRRARNGTGHTMMVVRADRVGEGRVEAEDVYGNLPPAQPTWQTAAETKRNFTNDEGGGPGANSLGEIYSHIGGGLKRFRVAKNVRGSWTNSWMAGDEASWINDRDYDRIAARPAQFAGLLGEVTPEQRRDTLLGVITAKRQHLTQYPASCSAREARERAFDELYALLQTSFGLAKEEVDRQYRTMDDYVFAELDYLRSSTCCWNRSTPQMYRIIVDYAQSLQTSGCTDPFVFKKRGGAYQAFADFAASSGRAAQWLPWTEDEACAQRAIADDVEAVHAWTAWCTIAGGELPAGCTEDGYEENDSAAAARTAAAGSYDAAVCSGDDDWFSILVDGRPLTVTISFTHANGDLDLELTDASGTVLQSSAGTGNSESVARTTVSGQRYLVHVYGYRGAEGSYRLTVTLDG
jgi:hypothetical protein